MDGMFNCETHIFHIYFFNIEDCSLIMRFTSMKTPIHDAETHWEGNSSHNFDIGLSFNSILCRRMEFQNYYKKSQKVICFLF